MILEDLAAHLEGLSLASRPSQGGAGDLFLSRLPETPDAAVALYQTAGGPPEYAQEIAGPTVERPHVQVVVRAVAYSAAASRARAIFDALAAVLNATLGSTRVLKLTPLQSPFLLRRDEKDRPHVAFNLEAEIAS